MHFQDILEIMALLLIGTGLAFIHWPSALATVGAILLALSLYGRRVKGGDK